MRSEGEERRKNKKGKGKGLLRLAVQHVVIATTVSGQKTNIRYCGRQ